MCTRMESNLTACRGGNACASVVSRKYDLSSLFNAVAGTTSWQTRDLNRTEMRWVQVEQLAALYSRISENLSSYPCREHPKFIRRLERAAGRNKNTQLMLGAMACAHAMHLSRKLLNNARILLTIEHRRLEAFVSVIHEKISSARKCKTCVKRYVAGSHTKRS